MGILKAILQKLVPKRKMLGGKGGARTVAILLDSVSPDLSARLLAELSPEERASLLAEFPAARLVSTGSRTFAIARYLDVELTGSLIKRDHLCKDLIATLESILRSDISKSARELSPTLRAEARVSIAEALEAIRVGGGWAERAAIVLDSLTDELSSDMLCRMSPESVVALKKAGGDLPFIRDARRKQELFQFLNLSQETHELDSLLQILGVLATAEPQRCAEQIEYYGRSKV